MGTLPLSFEQFSVQKKQNELQWQNSQKSNPSTPWLLSTSPRKDGTNSPELSPRPLDSLWPRLLPALLNSTTNIAACMLVMKTPTSASLISSTTKPKHSLSGSMKKISSESFPCKREEMYEVYSKDWPEVLRLYKTPSRLNPARTSNCPKNSVTFTLAQPILELA